MLACPADVDTPSYIALVAAGQFKEAMSVHMERNPFPSICGRVCHHPCETMCKRAEIDDGVSVAAIKRFMGDTVQSTEIVQPVPPSQIKRVAVVGAGPAGLSCAYQLVQVGFPVTVFDALPVAGGMLAVGLPGFRLPKDVVAREIEAIADLGVEIRLSQALGRDFSLDSLLEDGYEAIFLALGTHVSTPLGVENDAAPGVLLGMEFLRDVNLGDPPAIGARVVVIGGGSVAMDAARSALRLQEMNSVPRDVTIVYRRSRHEMPAYEWEIVEGDEEGLAFEYQAAPSRIVLDAQGHVAGLGCLRMELAEPDASGRRRPVAVPGSEFVVACDTVIPAIGLSVDLSWLSGELEVSERGTIATDPLEFRTTHPKVFAGGDAVRGPATLIEAIGDGQQAAFAIERALTDNDYRRQYLDHVQRLRRAPRAVPVEELEAIVPRGESELVPANQRVRSFVEVVRTMTADEARREACRCLRCDLEH